jgi:hypothetical protein
MKITRRILVSAIAGIAIEILGILGYITIAKTTFATQGKQILAAVILAVLVLFLLILARMFSVKSLVLLAAFFAIGAAIVVQILGHAFFPGLVKDIDLLSWENLKMAVMVTFLVFCFYILGILLIVAVRNVISWYDRLTAK